jgi:5-methylcytosine-specific restriction endonuclease McrA
MNPMIQKRDSKGRIMKGNPMRGKQNHEGENNTFFGKKHTKQTKDKIRNNHPHLNLKGENHFNWKGGAMVTMKKYALERDDNTCQVCGLKDEEIMVVDHIKPKSIYPELASKLDNLMTLCPNCHARKTVREYKEILRFKKAKL